MLIPVAALLAVVAPVIVQVKTVTAQLSDVTGLGVATEATHEPAPTLAVMLAGQVMVGLMLSTTVTVKEQVALLPAASRTVYVTVLTPVLNESVPTLLMPVAGLDAVVAPVIIHVKRVTAQLSAVIGLVVTTEVAQVPTVTLAVILEGQVMVGFTLSVTVTVIVHVLEFPVLSVAVHVMVVVPNG